MSDIVHIVSMIKSEKTSNVIHGLPDDHKASLQCTRQLIKSHFMKHVNEMVMILEGVQSAENEGEDNLSVGDQFMDMSMDDHDHDEHHMNVESEESEESDESKDLLNDVIESLVYFMMSATRVKPTMEDSMVYMNKCATAWIMLQSPLNEVLSYHCGASFRSLYHDAINHHAIVS